MTPSTPIQLLLLILIDRLQCHKPNMQLLYQLVKLLFKTLCLTIVPQLTSSVYTIISMQQRLRCNICTLMKLTEERKGK